MSWQAERNLFAHSSTNFITFPQTLHPTLHPGEERRTFPPRSSLVRQCRRCSTLGSTNSIFSSPASRRATASTVVSNSPPPQRGGALCGKPCLVYLINLQTLFGSPLSNISKYGNLGNAEPSFVNRGAKRALPALARLHPSACRSLQNRWDSTAVPEGYKAESGLAADTFLPLPQKRSDLPENRLQHRSATTSPPTSSGY